MLKPKDFVFRGTTIDDTHEIVYGDLLKTASDRRFILVDKFGPSIDPNGALVSRDYPFVREVSPDSIEIMSNFEYYGGIVDEGAKNHIFSGDTVRAVFVDENDNIIQTWGGIPFTKTFKFYYDACNDHFRFRYIDPNAEGNAFSNISIEDLFDPNWLLKFTDRWCDGEMLNTYRVCTIRFIRVSSYRMQRHSHETSVQRNACYKATDFVADQLTEK